jgi:dipeptidyl aminopeptidase/acylaminoacyl peptidase
MNMSRSCTVLVLAALGVAATAAPAARQDNRTPTIDQAIELKRAGSPAISPDGRRVAYTVRETNWDDNAFETEIWIVETESGQPRQLTRGKKSSTSPAWSPDGRRLAFISDRSDKRQLYVINPDGGEADPLTTDAKDSAPEGVTSIAWAPDGKSIAFTAKDPRPEPLKDRDKKYGEFDVVDQDHLMTHLHVVDVASKAVKRLTDGPMTVGSFDWAPDGSRIAFDHRINDDPSNGSSADVSIVRVADKSVRKLVTQDGPDTSPRWSPDGARIAFETAMANPWFYYANGLIAVIPSAGGESRGAGASGPSIDVLTKTFDEDPILLDWGADGIYFSAAERTYSHLYRIDPATKSFSKLTKDARGIPGGFTFTSDFSRTAFLTSSADTFPEVAAADVATMSPRTLTDLGAQLKDWSLGTSEVISWKSTDGTTIEGALHKPPSFSPGRRYPLLVVIHGGPTGISRPAKFRSNSVYPIDIWLSKGALVLEPNYRGSAGYGEKFRSLNVRNLGVGDAWDVVSGIDHLIAQGLVDRDRVGAMGWSQGGYISAFLTTHDSARFKAISVGAGISDWMTYYVNTDIHPFTRQYLKATPWDDPQIYAKTSPITYIKGARAPTLIQHGELDQRVPIPNAYELYQGLQDQGVPTKLIVYKGFGHGLNKPKAQRAAMEHNLEWFDRYLFGQPATTTNSSRQ